jgi:UDP-glucose 4-epimerase
VAATSLNDPRRVVLVLGGAGFLGSHVVRRFARGGWRVVVVDGLLPRTGGRAASLADLAGRIELIPRRVEELADLTEHLERSEVVIDCMAWTRHQEALADPLYDLSLNLTAHLHLVGRLPAGGGQRVIYLGSRGQYGRVEGEEITEDTPMVPCDVQGVHKVAAESHYRIFAGLRRLAIVSLRLPNCFGPGQPVDGEDVGLVGGFVRDLLARRPVVVYGTDRSRYLAYAPDVAEAVWLLAECCPPGFAACNYAGRRVGLGELATRLCELVGTGEWRGAPMPEALARTEVGDARISDARLRRLLPVIPCTPLAAALRETVADVRRRLEPGE